MLRRVLFILTLIALIAPAAFASKVADLTRIKGQGEFKLRGLGLVVGLQGTGDAGKEPILARPLAKLLENEGNAPGKIEELSAAKAVAVVWSMSPSPRSAAAPTIASMRTSPRSTAPPASRAGGSS